MLLLARNSAIDDMTSAEQASAMVQAIAQTAQEKWGEDWLPNLVREYAQIEQQETGNQKATPVNRRSQIVTVLSEGNPRTETLVRLATAVGAEVQLVVTRREVKRFS
jgi:DNA-binding phage protein